MFIFMYFMYLGVFIYVENLVRKVSTTINSVRISKWVRVMILYLLIRLFFISINVLSFGWVFHLLSSCDMQDLKEVIDCSWPSFSYKLQDRLKVYINNLIIRVGFLIIFYAM